MKVHTTNYLNTFITVADDCPAKAGEMPPVKEGTKSVALMQLEMILSHPYEFTSDEVFFQIYAERNKLSEKELAAAREQFFSKGQPCFRASPLTKRYGWGIHSNEDGRIALLGCETLEYNKFSKDKKLKVLKAMKSSK